MSRWPKKETENIATEVIENKEPLENKEQETIEKKEPVYEVKVLEIISFKLGTKCYRMEPVGRFVPVSKEVYEFLQINPYNYLLILSSDILPDDEIVPELEELIQEITPPNNEPTVIEPERMTAMDLSNMIKQSIFNVPNLLDDELEFLKDEIK